MHSSVPIPIHRYTFLCMCCLDNTCIRMCMNLHFYAFIATYRQHMHKNVSMHFVKACVARSQHDQSSLSKHQPNFNKIHSKHLLQKPVNSRHRPEVCDNWKHKLQRQIYIDKELGTSRKSVDQSTVFKWFLQHVLLYH